MHLVHSWLAEVRAAKHLAKVDLRVVGRWRALALHEGAGEHVHASGLLGVPRRRLEIRCDTRTVQLQVIVVCVGWKSARSGGSARCRGVQVLLDRRLLVLEWVHERVLVVRCGLLLVEISTIVPATTEDLLSTRLAEHVGG